jgi:hypothetical protein
VQPGTMRIELENDDADDQLFCCKCRLTHYERRLMYVQKQCEKYHKQYDALSKEIEIQRVIIDNKKTLCSLQDLLHSLDYITINKRNFF